MQLRIAYSGRSKPSALLLAETGAELGLDVCLFRGSSEPVKINWGRNVANSTLNPDISNVTNKRVMRELFKEHNVPMPELVSWSDVSSDLSRGISRDIIGRPDKHTKKRGFWRIESLSDMNKAMQGTRKKKAATHFMEFVEHEREYRVHIFKGKSIRISEKNFLEDGTYTTKKPGEIRLCKVRDAAKKAVEAVGLDFGAVDILARGDNNEEVFVLEVNAAPGLGGSMPRLYIETFCNWIEGENNE